MIALKRLTDHWKSRPELTSLAFRTGEVEPGKFPYVYLMPGRNIYSPTSRVDASEGKRVCKCTTEYKLVIVDKKLEDAVETAQLVSDAFDNQKVSTDCITTTHKDDTFGVDNMFLYQVTLNYVSEFTLLQSN